MRVRFIAIDRCFSFCLATIITTIAVQPANAAVLNVLTADTGGAGSFDFLTGGRFNNVRDALTNPANYGPGGIVTDTVNYLPSVTTFNSANLSGADVVILAHGATTRPANEINALNTFVQNGGGILAFSNEIGSDLSAILGSTFGGYLDGPNIQVSNASSPIANGSFGTFPVGTSTGTSFGGLLGTVGPNGTVGITRNGNPFAATYDFGTGRAAVFLDEEMFISAALGGADARWNTTHNAYFLNAFDYVANSTPKNPPVPEPHSEPYSVLILIAGILGFRLRRRKKG